MAIRVLAMIPDLSPKREPVVKTVVDPSARKDIAKPSRVVPRARKDGRRRRGRSRSAFPTSSIVALAVVAAAIWSYVAVREMVSPDNAKAEQRLASEPASVSTGTTLR